MPKRVFGNDVEIPKKKSKAKPRIASNGYRLPDPIPQGEILTDNKKSQWRLGRAIGLGGFGEIYLASNDVARPVSQDAPFVIKIEHHSNGPLFSEMHFYHRVGKEELIEEWVKRKKLDYIGMPKFVASGSHEYQTVKYRFMVMQRFGEDLQKLLDRNNRHFPPKTALTLGLRIIDVLEYIHHFGYIHADVKASNLLVGYGPGKENQVYLVDFGLACRYNTTDGKHKEYKEDLRKAHDGTIEFTSRDAHIGAHSRRGDLEILGYNMIQWICGKLPWEDNLKDVEYVSQQKSGFMSNLPLLMQKCFPKGNPPAGLHSYLAYVANLKFDEDPDYDYLKEILSQGLKREGYKNDGQLVFTNSPALNKKNSSPKKAGRPRVVSMNCDETYSPPVQRKKGRSVLDKTPSAHTRSPSLNRKPPNRKALSAAPGLSAKVGQQNGSCGLDNPTPAMLMVMQRKQELLALQEENKGKKSSPNPNNYSPPPNQTPPAFPLFSCPTTVPIKGKGRKSPDFPAKTKDQKIQTLNSGLNHRVKRKPLCSTACQTSPVLDENSCSPEY